ncbi:MAG: FAD-dependent monooxygenase [Planctomycetota bacterium]
MRDGSVDGGWDAVVIGAGVAGGAAAIGLARAGARVLVVEKARFPRGKACGGCLGGVALAELRRLGLAGEVGRWSRPVERMRLVCGGRSWDWGLPAMAAVRREALDAALVDAAVSAGAEFRDGCRAEVVDAGDAGRAASVWVGERVVSAEAVVLADGLGGSGEPGAAAGRWRVAGGSRVGVSMRGSAGEAGEAPRGVRRWVRGGAVSMAVGRGGYVGAVRMDDGAVHLAGALDAGMVREHGGAARAVAAVLSEAGGASVDSATRDWLANSAWCGAPALTRRRKRVAWGRCLAVGDAAGYVEPFTGEGMGWALAAAREASTLVAEVVRDGAWDRLSVWSAVCRAGRGRRWTAGWVRRAVRRPGLLSAAMRVGAVARPTVGAVLARTHPVSA